MSIPVGSRLDDRIDGRPVIVRGDPSPAGRHTVFTVARTGDDIVAR